MDFRHAGLRFVVYHLCKHHVDYLYPSLTLTYPQQRSSKPPVPLTMTMAAMMKTMMTTTTRNNRVTNCDAWTVFSFSLPLFIACTITVGHVTDDLYFRM
jgi:hypothetical protein